VSSSARCLHLAPQRLCAFRSQDDHHVRLTARKA
jgi:hypothetical protein